MTKRPNALKFIEAYVKYNIRRSVKDRELRRKLTPHYRIGCKRILNSSTYYRAVADPKTELITDHIARITPNGIVTADGKEREADVIVYGTGFHVTDSYTYVQVKGHNGEDLVDRWNREGIAAHRGITVADMPNLFFLLGPNTGLGHNSVVFMIESQIRYVASAIKTCDKLGAQALAPTRAAQDRFNDELQRRLGPSVWNSGGCSQLVSRRARQEHGAVGRLHLGVLAGHPLGQAGGVPVLRGGRRSPAVRPPPPSRLTKAFAAASTPASSSVATRSSSRPRMTASPSRAMARSIGPSAGFSKASTSASQPSTAPGTIRAKGFSPWAARA